MPRTSAGSNYAPCGEGEDILVRLKAVEEVTNDENSRFKPGETRWRWVFETLEERNEDGEPFLVSLYTGTVYIAKSTQCKLTKLLDKICRELTTEEKEDFDTDTLLNKRFRIDVTHVTGENGRVRANIDSIKRVTEKKKAKPIEEEDDEEDDDGDPFKDE